MKGQVSAEVLIIAGLLIAVALMFGVNFMSSAQKSSNTMLLQQGMIDCYNSIDSCTAIKDKKCIDVNITNAVQAFRKGESWKGNLSSDCQNALIEMATSKE